MRHLRSIFYALVLAPCIWVLLAVGFTDDLSSRGRDFFAAESISGLLLLIFAGILFSILAAGPVSPAGPVLAGAAYFGVTIWAFNAPAAYASLWAPQVAKEGFDLSRPGYGLAAVLAVPLLGTALSGRRWARYEPPVLPIIGEVGRFRGAAKVAGTTVASEQTTVIRTGVPAARTVSVGNGHADDRTVAISTGMAAADRTAVVPSADRTEPLGRATSTGTSTDADTNSDRTVFVNQPQPSAAHTPVAQPSAAQPSVEKDEDTVVQARPDEDRTEVLAPSAVADPDLTRPVTPATAEAVSPASAEKKAVPTSVTEPEEETTPLNLSTEPTTVIPAQRRPPAIES